MIDRERAQAIVDYLNELLELDRPAIAALVANRVPCNERLSEHPTCQVGRQHGGWNVGLLGLLNGFCGIDDISWGGIAAVFDNPEGAANTNEWYDLVRFIVREPVFTPQDTDD